MVRSVIAVTALHLMLGLTLFAPPAAGSASPKEGATTRAPKLLPSGPAFKLTIAQGVPIFGSIAMPTEFVAATERPPLWLAGGTEVALIGSRGTRTVVVGFSGPRFSVTRIVAADPEADADPEHILDFAVSKDTMAWAIAAARSQEGVIEVLTRDLNGGPDLTAVAQVEGHFTAARVSWLDRGTIALALSGGQEADAKHAFYTINAHAQNLVHKVKWDCESEIEPARLHWSPDGKRAISEPTPSGPPLAITPADSQCGTLKLAAPYGFRFLDWNPAGKRFLYAGSAVPTSPSGAVSSVYEHDLDSEADQLVGPVPAAAFGRDGAIVVFGNRKLTSDFILRHPNAPVPVELGVIEPNSHGLTVLQLGLSTSAALLTQGVIKYSPASDTLALQALVPGPPGGASAILYAHLSTGQVGLLASAPPQEVPMSWAPQGDLLALLDYSGGLFVVAPPR